MSDDRRTSAAPLPGDPAAWRATTRDLLRYLRAESPRREDAVAWLREETADDDRSAAADALEFLEAIGVVESSPEGCTPDHHGREFLDTHDEAVLYRALTSNVAGFETLLESLAVRPLTDVEFTDLLEREFDADLGSPDRGVGHRKWLEALGYVAHDAGVNELTRSGRLLVETGEDLAPPRAGGPAGPHGPGEASGADGPATPRAADPDDGRVATTDGRSTVEAAGDAAGEDGADREDDAGGADGEPAASDAAPGGASPAPFAADLKRRYDHTCAVCGDRRRRAPDEGFSRVYHPMPLSAPHDGPADPENAVVVCPNHHADFRHGLVTVDPRTLEVDHAYEPAVSGRTLATVEGHAPGAQFLAYHAEVLAEF